MLFWTTVVAVFLVGLSVAFAAGARHAQARQRRIDEIRRYRWRPPVALYPSVETVDTDRALTARIAQLRAGGRRP